MMSCYTCKAELKDSDFHDGRAVALLGRTFCQACQERAMELGRPGAESSRGAHKKKGETNIIPADTWERSDSEEEDLKKRAEARKAPPFGCELYLRKAGISGLFGGNAVRLWLDVSMRGGRAIMDGKFSIGDEISLLIVHNGWKERIDAAASIRHISPSEQHPGSSLVGFRFEHRSEELRDFLQRLIQQSGGTSPSRCLKGKIASG